MFSRFSVFFFGLVSTILFFFWLYDADEQVKSVGALPAPTAMHAKLAESVPANALVVPSPAASATSFIGSSPRAQFPDTADSFSQNSNLWALALRASQSDEPQLQRAGLIAARECQGLLRLQYTLNVQIQMALQSRAERDLALSTLLDRCKGFVTADAGLSKSTFDKLRSLREGSAGQTPDAPSAAALLAVLAQRDPTTIEQASVQIANHLIAQLGLGSSGGSSDQKSDGLTMAALGAACDLGKDCSATAFHSLMQCAMVGVCGESIFNLRDSSLSDAEWARVLLYRQEIVRSVAEGNLTPIKAALDKD